MIIVYKYLKCKIRKITVPHPHEIIDLIERHNNHQESHDTKQKLFESKLKSLEAIVLASRKLPDIREEEYLECGPIQTAPRPPMSI